MLVFIKLFCYKTIPSHGYNPSLPLCEKNFLSQAKKYRKRLDFFCEMCYNILVGICVRILILEDHYLCLLSAIKTTE